MEAAVRRKTSMGLWLGVAGAILTILPLFLVLFLILAIAGGSTINENNNSNNVAGIYPPNGMQIPMYYQYHYKGVQYAFGGGDIGTNGCGPTSFAMVATYLLGRTVTPPDVVAWAGATTYYVPGVGMSWSFFTDAAAQYGCGEVIQTTNPDEVLQALSDNRPVICSQKDGIFTATGHFIVLRGVTTDGKVLVNDPNDNAMKNFINREFDMLSEVHSTANAYWIFEQRNVLGSGSYLSDFTNYNQEELELIWAIIQQEDNKSYEGALAVISCVMNRVDSPLWKYCGSNAYEQLTAPRQFCYSNDTFWQRWLGGNVYNHVKLAVEDCLQKGIRNHSYTSFRSTNGGDSSREQIGGNWYFN